MKDGCNQNYSLEEITHGRELFAMYVFIGFCRWAMMQL